MLLPILNRDLKKGEGRNCAGIWGGVAFQADRAFLPRPAKGPLVSEGEQEAGVEDGM